MITNRDITLKITYVDGTSENIETKQFIDHVSFEFEYKRKFIKSVEVINKNEGIRNVK